MKPTIDKGRLTLDLTRGGVVGFGLVALLAFCTWACLADKPQATDKWWLVQPKVPLARAIIIADQTLGKNPEHFYCTMATVIPPFGKPAEDGWEFVYSTTSGAQKNIKVLSDGRVLSQKVFGPGPSTLPPPDIRVY